METNSRLPCKLQTNVSIELQVVESKRKRNEGTLAGRKAKKAVKKQNLGTDQCRINKSTLAVQLAQGGNRSDIVRR